MNKQNKGIKTENRLPGGCQRRVGEMSEESQYIQISVYKIMSMQYKKKKKKWYNLLFFI